MKHLWRKIQCPGGHNHARFHHQSLLKLIFFGDFSSATPGVSDNTFEELNHPIGQLYLAGEAYISGLHSSTHGALIHGAQIGEHILQEILGPLSSKDLTL